MFASVRTLLVGGVVGKATGIARELVSATLFGTGAVAAAYRLSQAAFVIPLHGLVSESLSSGFTPTYSREHAENLERSRALFAGMHAVVLIFSLAVAILVEFYSTQWVRVLAPGFNPDSVKLTSQMVSVMALAMPLYAFTSLCAAAELATGKAEMAAARASVQSLGLIVGTVVAWWAANPVLIPAGFVLSYVWLAGWGLTLVVRDRLRIWPRRQEWEAARTGMLTVWGAFRLVVWIPIIMQVHFVVERRVASVVNVNAVAALDYARFVSDTAVLLLAMPFGLAGLGAMARMNAREFHDAAWRSTRMLLFIGIPLSAAVSLHADWVVRLIFARGAFGAESIATTSTILCGFGVGLWAQLVGYAGVKFLSSRGRNRAVVIIYVSSMVVNIVLNLLLPRFLGIAALGIAYAAGGWILGLAVMATLGQLRTLRVDLVALVAATLGYVVIQRMLPADISALRWFPPAYFIGYWGIVGALLPNFRVAAGDMLTVVRPGGARR